MKSNKSNKSNRFSKSLSLRIESLSFHYHHYLNCDKIYVIYYFENGTTQRLDYSQREVRNFLNLNTDGSPCPVPINFYHTFYNFDRPLDISKM